MKIADTHYPIHHMIVKELEVIGHRCADHGRCHHDCKTECFRKGYCLPLSMASTFLKDDWTYKEPQLYISSTN